MEKRKRPAKLKGMPAVRVEKKAFDAILRKMLGSSPKKRGEEKHPR